MPDTNPPLPDSAGGEPAPGSESADHAPATPAITLHCDSDHREYTLCIGPDSSVFSTTDAAVRFAATLVQCETVLVVYDMEGKVMLTTSVHPSRSAKRPRRGTPPA